ncbi:hypothetical protein MNB_SM-3-726 [hydrothermal vent metagenome]|uniref:Uncharacterized protein n=1 Tax=hydrothermal vent metagenome TaxID=652676 RepID=A0A1W1D478_9ZZZZ
MDKTRVDDMLIEMITPRVQEIEKKFGSGEGLTQEDINTLLLKSQYNHINHLDTKLNEVVADVASLKHSFAMLEQRVDQRFETFEQKLETFEQRFKTFDQRFEMFEQRFETFEQKIDATIQKAINKNMYLLIGVGSFLLVVLKLIDKISM